MIYASFPNSFRRSIAVIPPDSRLYSIASALLAFFILMLHFVTPSNASLGLSSNLVVKILSQALCVAEIGFTEHIVATHATVDASGVPTTVLAPLMKVGTVEIGSRTRPRRDAGEGNAAQGDVVPVNQSVDFVERILEYHGAKDVVTEREFLVGEAFAVDLDRNRHLGTILLQGVLSDFIFGRSSRDSGGEEEKDRGGEFQFAYLLWRGINNVLAAFINYEGKADGFVFAVSLPPDELC
jgi:hypothetical protein